MECADRLSVFFNELAFCDPVLKLWNTKGRSRKEAQKKQIDGSDREMLETLLEKGRNRRDFGGAVIEQLGFSISLWKPLSETGDEDIALSVHCGSYVATPNSVSVHLPEILGKFKRGRLYSPCSKRRHQGVGTVSGKRHVKGSYKSTSLQWGISACRLDALPSR